MFSKRFESFHKSFSRSHKVSKSSFFFTKDGGVTKRRHESRHCKVPAACTIIPGENAVMKNLSSATVAVVVGSDQRMFAAHEDLLCFSPFFRSAIRSTVVKQTAKKISLPDEEPEVFSSILEYLYTGDYFPRLIHSNHGNFWELEPADEGKGSLESTIHHRSIDGRLLKDTVIYCAAEKYGLEELKQLALRKQGLQSGIQCSTILASARYAYANTPDTDSKLRAHYLALIIRSRSTFKRSGTLQLEMFNGGTALFFDLFVALCTHVDDISSGQPENCLRSG